jgi:hypothetical protein
VPAAKGLPVEEPSRRETLRQALRIDEVRERALSVDLDHGKQLAVPPLELLIPCDVDELDLKGELCRRSYVANHLERTVAERAARRVVERDAARYGDRPRVVVASATRCTASPYEAILSEVS